MILVTGGAGFIGSMFVKELNEHGRKDIIIVDRLSESEKWKNLRNVEFDSYIHADDLFDPEIPRNWNPIEAIVHMGACSSTTEKDMDYLMENNVEYSKKLFLKALALTIPFIYASSAATYGAGELGYSDDHELAQKLRPLNRYGYSKFLFDRWVLAQHRKPTYWFGLKFFNVFGPQEFHKGPMRSVVLQAFEQIGESGKVKLFKSYRKEYKDGGQLRDFVYVKDVCRAMRLLLQVKDRKASGIYNMGTGKARSFLDLANATFTAMNVKPQIEFIDMPEGLDRQYQYFTEAKMEKFQRVLPDFRFSTLEEAVKDYVGYLSTTS